MTAYYDESGTHGADSPATIIAGFGATAAQWVGCEKRLGRLYGDFGIQTYHAKEFRGTKGDFKGWDKGTKARFHSRFLQIVDNQLSFGLATIVSPSDYQTHYRGKPFHRTARPDTKTGICFRAALRRSLLFIHEQSKNESLNVVLELGGPNEGDCVRIFAEEKRRFNGRLGVISFASKKDCRFLAVADSLAYFMFRNTAGYTKDPNNPARISAGPADPPYYVHKIDMAALTISERGLRQFQKQHRKAAR